MSAQLAQVGPIIGLVYHTLYNAALAWRLFWDRKVPLLLKALPLVAVVYLFAQDISVLPCIGVLTLGFLDDALVIYLLVNRAFIEWAPKKVVGNHQLALDEKFRPLAELISGPE